MNRIINAHNLKVLYMNKKTNICNCIKGEVCEFNIEYLLKGVPNEKEAKTYIGSTGASLKTMYNQYMHSFK